MDLNLKGRTRAGDGRVARHRPRHREGARGGRVSPLSLVARDAERLNGVCKELGAKALPFDLSRPENIGALVEACGDVEILVNNAGGIPRGTLEEIDGPTWRKAWDLKVFGYIDLTPCLSHAA